MSKKNNRLGLQWVSKVIGDSYKQWTQKDTIVIDSQTGTGKSSFITNILYGYIVQNNKKILYLYNRKSLGNQLYNVYNELMKKETVPNQKSSIRLMSYQSLARDIKSKKFKDYETYDYVVYDECHYLFHDSIFNNKISYVYDNFFTNRYGKAINIFMSSTMNQMNFEIKKHYQNITTFNTNRDYSYIIPHHFDRQEDIINTINNDSSNSKWMVFVPSINKGRVLKAQIDDSEFVCSTYNNKYNTKKNERLLAKIESENKFDCKCLITTKTLDNGISIKDDKVVNMVVFLYDKTDFLQMIGRKRIDIENPQNLNLYIFRITNKYLKATHYRNMNSTNRMLKLFETDYEEFCNKYNDDFNKVNECIFRLIEDESKDNINWEVILNGKATFLIKLFELTMIVKHLEQDKGYLLQEQLSWLGYDTRDSNYVYDVKSIYEVNLFEGYLNGLTGKKLFNKEQIELCDFMKKELRLSDSVLRKGIKRITPARLETLIRHYFRLNYVVEYGTKESSRKSYNYGKRFIRILKL